MIRWLHRYLGLALAVVWLTQALSGVIIVFGRDLGHYFAARPPAAFDALAFGAGLESFEASHPGRHIAFVLAADTESRWFDVLYKDGESPTWYARVDGRGEVFFQRPFFSNFPSPGLFMTALHLHQEFLNEDVGLTLVGTSGLFLLVSLIFGVQLAWPRAGRWRDSLRLRGRLRTLPGLYSWHRVLGMWLALPAILNVVAGILLALGGPLQARLHGEVDEPELTNKAATVAAPRLGAAVQTALAQFPGASLALLSTPGAENPWYRIRVRQLGEVRRIFGTSVVWVDARDGAVLQRHDALKARPAIVFFDALYPFHSGEMAGIAGRLLALASGFWLAAMTILGAALWWRRRSS